MESDYPIRVEISEERAETLRELIKGGHHYVDEWLNNLPRLPEQRACVGCAAWQAGPGFCKPGDLVADEATIVMFHPWWDISDAACPAWQPPRDKAEELAEKICNELFGAPPESGRKKNLEDIARVLREAGIGGESDE